MKQWLDPLSTAWTGVITHKLRAFLTILGIVIGVTAVITLMSVGRGATSDILADIESMGSDLIIIQPSSISVGGVRGGVAQTLTMEDAEAIAEEVPYISAVVPVYANNMQLVVGGENMNASVSGVTPDYWDVQNFEIASGSFFYEQEYQRGAKLAVLGSEVKETLFPDTDPIGQRLRMGTIIVTIIGVVQEKGGLPGQSPDDAIFIPLTAMQQAVAQPRTVQGDRIVSSISLTVNSEEHASYVTEEITTLLHDRHRLGPGVDDDFRVISMEEVATMFNEATDTLTQLLGAIAAISLLVGGIGVMNIMLVSVLERTREIGIRKALGARERDIWLQFLIEAAFLTFAGGIIGTVIGWVIAFLFNSMGVMTTVVTVDIILLAVGVSVAIGLFFGFYPAWNASRLEPVEALRSE